MSLFRQECAKCQVRLYFLAFARPCLTGNDLSNMALQKPRNKVSPDTWHIPGEKTHPAMQVRAVRCITRIEVIVSLENISFNGHDDN